QHKGTLGLRRRGDTLLVDVDAVTGLAGSSEAQGAAMLLAAYDDLKPADLADVIHDLGDTRRLEVAGALDNERLADVLEELPEDDPVAILAGLPSGRAADVREAMPPHDAAAPVHGRPGAQAGQRLELTAPEAARGVRRLPAYAADTAGALMSSGPVALGPETT